MFALLYFEGEKIMSKLRCLAFMQLFKVIIGCFLIVFIYGVSSIVWKLPFEFLTFRVWFLIDCGFLILLILFSFSNVDLDRHTFVMYPLLIVFILMFVPYVKYYLKYETVVSYSECLSLDYEKDNRDGTVSYLEICQDDTGTYMALVDDKGGYLIPYNGIFKDGLLFLPTDDGIEQSVDNLLLIYEEKYQDKNTRRLVDMQGNVVHDAELFSYSRIGEEILYFRDINNNSYIYNYNTKVKSEFDYKYIKRISDSYSLFQRDDKYYVFDYNLIETDISFDSPELFASENGLIFHNNNNFYLRDEEVLIPLTMDSFYKDDNGDLVYSRESFVYEKNGRYGIYNVDTRYDSGAIYTEISQHFAIYAKMNDGFEVYLNGDNTGVVCDEVDIIEKSPYSICYHDDSISVVGDDIYTFETSKIDVINIDSIFFQSDGKQYIYFLSNDERVLVKYNYDGELVVNENIGFTVECLEASKMKLVDRIVSKYSESPYVYASQYSYDSVRVIFEYDGYRVSKLLLEE